MRRIDRINHTNEEIQNMRIKRKTTKATQKSVRKRERGETIDRDRKR